MGLKNRSEIGAADRDIIVIELLAIDKLARQNRQCKESTKTDAQEIASFKDKKPQKN